MRKTVQLKTCRPSHFFGALLVLAAAGFSATPCSAAGDKSSAARAAQVDRLNEAGASHYARREYRQAIDFFSKALAIDPDPNLLFNIARCHERLGENQAAIDNYELFISTPGADAEGRGRAQAALTALRQSQQAASSTEPAAAPVANQTVVATAQVAEPTSSNVLPWLTLGGGAGLLALGATVYFIGAADHRKVTNANGFGDDDGVVDLTYSEAQDLVDSGDQKKMLGGVGLGIGGALLATYVILLTTDGSSAEPTDVAFSVVPSSSGAAFSFQGSF